MDGIALFDAVDSDEIYSFVALTQEHIENLGNLLYNVFNSSGQTAMHACCNRGRLEMLRFMDQFAAIPLAASHTPREAYAPPLRLRSGSFRCGEVAGWKGCRCERPGDPGGNGTNTFCMLARSSDSRKVAF